MNQQIKEHHSNTTVMRIEWSQSKVGKVSRLNRLFLHAFEDKWNPLDCEKVKRKLHIDIKYVLNLELLSRNVNIVSQQ